MRQAPEQVPYLHREGGRLLVEQADTGQLARQFGTPLFVVSESRLRANYRRIRDAFTAAWAGPVNVMFAIKTNYALAIRRILTQEGAGGDAFGTGELMATLAAGTDPERTSLGGSGKPAAAIHEAVARGVRITVDALDELPLIAEAARASGRRAVLTLRSKPSLDELNLYRSVASPYRMGAEIPLGDWILDNKWGLTIEEACEALRIINSAPELQARGVHSHVGRHYGFGPQYVAAVPGLVRWIAAVRDRTGWAPDWVDLGGGWAAEDDPVLRGPGSQRQAGGHPELWQHPRGPIEEIAADVCTELRRRLAEASLDIPALEIEPGRYIVTDAVILLARVTSVKNQPGIARYINVDASVAHFPIPELQDAAIPVVLAEREADPQDDQAAIVGPSCFEDLLSWGQRLPAMQPGDLVAFFEAGACADAYSATTNAIPRPAVVLICGDRAELIKRRETVQDIFSRDQIPARLWRDRPAS
jgi:diaminopimelate decarboxylase